MRMIHYFRAAVLCALPALAAAVWLGFRGSRESHVLAGLIGAILVVGVHTLVILFMLVTGRVLREAMRTRDLPAALLSELNEFFSRRKAYPVAIFGSLAIVAAGVLGQAGTALGLHPALHVAAGSVAIVFNLWSFALEAKSLRANQDLLDRAASILDAIDRELAAKGVALPFEDSPPDPRRIASGALVVAASAWLPYLYWVFVEWRGDFRQVSVHPWIEISLAALLVWLFVLRARPSAPAGS